MKSIDKDVLAAYNLGIEKNRLRSGLGLIEFQRTKEIIQQTLPPAPAVIFDIGGGYGEYSFWLSSMGYEVYLYDISEKNIEMARELSKEYPHKLKTMEVADARSIDLPEKSADAILLFGPLYHIVDKEEIEKAGFSNTDVRGVIGPCWLVPNLDELWKDETRRESIMNIVRMCEKEEAIMGLSTHLLAISEKRVSV